MIKLNKDLFKEENKDMELYKKYTLEELGL